MEPIPESLWVARQQLERGDTNLTLWLRWISKEVERIVPECVGFSLASPFEGITYTLAVAAVVVASSAMVPVQVAASRAMTSPEP